MIPFLKFARMMRAFSIAEFSLGVVFGRLRISGAESWHFAITPSLNNKDDQDQELSVELILLENRKLIWIPGPCIYSARWLQISGIEGWELVSTLAQSIAVRALIKKAMETVTIDFDNVSNS
jgi:hypothetical protein